MIAIFRAILFYISLSALTLMLLVGVFWVAIWRQKKRQDRESYEKIYHHEHVKTCHTPDEYIAESSKIHSKTSKEAVAKQSNS